MIGRWWKRKRHEERLRPAHKEMLVASYGDETRIAVLEEGKLQEIFVENRDRRSIVGDIYKGKVQNVLPGMEAAFVDIGHRRNALLYVGDIFIPQGAQGGRRGRPEIGRLLRPGQEVVVQVTKDPMGGKGARLTTYLSIAGRYLVLLPQLPTIGVSQKLDPAERERLRELAERIRQNGMGLIVRTAARGAREEDLRKSYGYLVKLWKNIQREMQKKKAPSPLYLEPELEIKVMRDVLDSSFDRVLVDSEKMYKKIRQYLKEVSPELADRVSLYDGSRPLFEAMEVNRQIKDALKREVQLPSGGTIVIDHTEALTVIDVNTKSFVGKNSLEDTVLRTNLEAVREIARQLRLRDIGGIIIIDFIDMNEPKNRKRVLRALHQELEKDRTKAYVVDLTKLGLVELTRKNVSEGLLEAFSEKCPVCDGRGVIFREP
ncbi:MAG: Rne/Rng family ribonuclease [Candidatus Geothermincolales bacterium]